ncbi:MAG TPA: glycosyltransferase family A protein [Thermoanaerobaculia bacterium]|nr:glycosyltransferase family A protein [Thermoanaerobaculia bacterium]
MSGDRPIAVVIPVRDGEGFLAEAIESALAHPHVGEVVVVDDGSADGSLALARSYRGVETLALGSTRGPAAARNAGLATIRAPVVSFLDGDDRWPEFGASGDPRLTRLLADPELDFVVGRLRMFRREADGSVTYSEPRRQLQVGAALYRRRIFDRVGPFDEALVGCEDFDWYARAREAGARIEQIDDVTLFYRRHAGNLTADPEVRRHLVALPVRAALLRRRAGKPEEPPK